MAPGSNRRHNSTVAQIIAVLCYQCLKDLHAAFEALLESLTDEKYDLSIASFRWQWVESGKTLKQLEAKGRLVLQLYDFGWLQAQAPKDMS